MYYHWTMFSRVLECGAYTFDNVIWNRQTFQIFHLKSTLCFDFHTHTQNRTTSIYSTRIASIGTWTGLHSKDKLLGIFNQQKGIYDQRIRNLIVLIYRFVCNAIQYACHRTVATLLSTIEAYASFRIKLTICFCIEVHVKCNNSIDKCISFCKRAQEYPRCCILRVCVCVSGV